MAESLQRGKYRKLETAIIATTLCFALLPILVAGLVIPPRFSDLYHQKAVREVEHVARSKGRTIDVFLGERTAQLRSLAEMFTFEELTAPGQLPRILRAIKTGSRSYVDLGIIDMDGRHVAYAGAYDISEVNYQNELWFAEVKRTGVFISDVFMGFRNFPHIIIAVMREEEGRFWILRATIDSAVFTSIVQDSRLSAGGDAFVLNADGHLQTESLLAGHVMTPVSVPWPRQGASISEERLNGKD
ncbi:cache domain-containing protein, partial [Desulfosarcina sp. OttesenSCG-928-G10]|nr:cache domain-containing protein [Desulfosarcina sp. OttesenSCG-928-G10]